MHSSDSPHAGGPAPPNPLLLVHRYLRGRYWLAIPLAVLAAIPGAIAGFMATKPQYEAFGRVEIAPKIDLLLQETDRNDVMPMYQNFVNGEAMLAQGQRVIRRALEINDAQLVKAGWPGGIEGVRMLAGSLSAAAQRNTNFIVIRVTFSDARLAKEAAVAVLAAYMDLYGDNSAESVARDKADLERLQGGYEAELAGIDRRINSTAEAFKTDDLSYLKEHYFRMATDLEFRISSTELELAIQEARRTSGGQPGEPVIDDRLLEARYPAFADLMSRVRSLQLQLQGRLANVSDTHRSKREVLRELWAIQEQVDVMRPKLVTDIMNAPADPLSAGVDLERQLDILQKQLVDANAELERVDRAHAELERLKEEREEVKASLRRVSEELHAININMDRLEGRIVVRDAPEIPPAPAKDRRLPFAAAGAAATGGIVVLGFVALGFLDRRLKYADQITETNVAPLLGVLPTLTTKNQEQRQIAAESVHHLRNMIEVQLDRLSPTQAARSARCRQCGATIADLNASEQACRQCGCAFDPAETASTRRIDAVAPGRGRSIVVTSGGAGDGKTSVTMALGMSFAAAGRRTVVVDADLVGRGLSDSLRLQGAPGLTELSLGSPLNGELHETEVACLWAVPSGRDDAKRPEHLSKGFTSELIRGLESRFDVVLIDTGPLLGSLEANLVAGSSTGVLLVVSKGQDGKLVDMSLRRLAEIGANCIGLVYNRATAADIARSASAVSGSRSVRSTASDSKGSSNRPLISVMGRQES